LRGIILLFLPISCPVLKRLLNSLLPPVVEAEEEMKVVEEKAPLQ